MSKGRSIAAAVLALIVIVVVVVLLKTSSKEDGEIRIGAIFPLSGRYAAMGTPLKFATDIAVAEVNASGGIGGKPVRVLYEDSKGAPKDGATAAQKLITIDKVPIVTSFLTGVCEAIKPIAENSGTLFLAQTVAPRIHQGSRVSLRFHYSFTEEGRVIREFIAGQNVRRIGVIHSNDPSTSYEVDSIIVPFLAEKGTTTVNESFSIGNKDFSAIVQKMLSSKVGLIYMAGYGNDMPAMLTELHKTKKTSRNIILCGNIGFIELPSGTPAELYEGVVFTMPPFVNNMQDSALNSFRKKYRDASGEEQVGYAAYYAFDMIKILAEALKNSPSVGSAILRSQLAGEFHGICGTYLITADGDVTPPVTLGRFVKGTIVSAGR
jgi:branched-chain amino acid transport system substrate-binding protein